MKKEILSLTMLAAVLCVENVSAQTSGTATANASASVVTPLTVINLNGNLSFGNIAPSGTAGAVILAPNGTRTFTGGVSALPGGPSVGTFQVTGENGFTYSITLPVSVSLTNTTSGGAQTLLANNFTSFPTPTGVLTGGSQTLLVGATLLVPGGSVPGVYSTATPFSVTVNYN
ncbi:DUF4402 domain-containing protein [Chitinophaga flava]|uniref:DUF4402 domain-containing protein n=1 Tax=Chitinophaga flava TaxID=2259036 RepID=A0A365XYR6_9BACT|nr:DUF4402 domain-containing protein [Chitinophaga flava]RBL91208.1 hypothetical protein DF182_00875 [Chitinophaga flava]